MKYNYNATIVKIIDGDTIKLDVDVGFKMTFRDNFRLLRIDAPEVRRKECCEWLKKEVPIGSTVSIATHKPGKYGRWLCEIFYVDSDGDSRNLNDMLVKHGFAVYREY